MDNVLNNTKDFLNSNNIVAKASFILLTVLIFSIVFKLCLQLLMWLITPSNSPRLINGMIDGSHTVVIPQNPKHAGSITVPRSVNTSKGIEFTWSIWLYVKNDKPHSSYRHVFNKGTSMRLLNRDDITDDGSVKTGVDNGIMYPNNAPGLYLTPHTNDMVIIMNTYDNIDEHITINDIPLNKWINVVCTCQGHQISVYINGTIAKSHKLMGVPKQNYEDVNVALNGGFNGQISNLFYYNYALSPKSIRDISRAGPNTSQSSVMANIQSTYNNYLSMNWFFG